jgi:hypothetical protein
LWKLDAARHKHPETQAVLGKEFIKGQDGRARESTSNLRVDTVGLRRRFVHGVWSDRSALAASYEQVNVLRSVAYWNCLYLKVTLRANQFAELLKPVVARVEGRIGFRQ